jgi:hypothetical protein
VENVGCEVLGGDDCCELGVSATYRILQSHFEAIGEVLKAL